MLVQWAARLCLLYILLLSGELTECRQFRCDYTYSVAAAGWLKLHREPDSWRRARLRCHLEGANLASPTPTLKPVMKSMMESKRVSSCGIFTGIHASISPGDYHSVEGQPLWKIPHTWAESEPDNYLNQENCIAMLPDGALADVNCSDTYPYMCYRKSGGLVVNSCGTTDPEYSLETRTGSCYKFHREPRSWADAYMACSAEGGHLAIINSDAEAQVIKDIFGRNPANKLQGGFWKDVAFMGFHNWNDKGKWLTVHGMTLEEAGYDKFSPGEPNNFTTGEYCGAVYRSALLDDLWCENKYAFICEKNVDSLLCDDDEMREN